MSKSVHLAFDVLELLEDEGAPLRLTDVAVRLEQAKATIHRTLAALEARGYAVQLDDERYRLGVRCVTLGASAADLLDLRTVARGHLEALNAATRENVHLAVYERGEVIYLDKIDSHHAVAPKSRVGERAPSVAVSTGRALLAYQSATEIERVIEAGLPAFTPRSITEPDRLLALLEQIREEGLARNHSSWRDGVCGVAAPIRDHTGMVVASVGCCLPEPRFTEDRQAELEAAVLDAADAISHQLGHRPTRARGVA